MSTQVPQGQVVSLLGPNGAGKSTLIDLILGPTSPDAGEVRISGMSPADAVRTGTIGAMLRSTALLDDATVSELVGMVNSLHRHPLGVPETLQRAGIADLASRRSTRLSGGQRQRVAYGLAIAGDPDVLVLDEPTAAMDVASRHAFWASLREVSANGRTVLFATHHLAEAEEFADRVVFMQDGRIIADGTVTDVQDLAAGREVSASVPVEHREDLARLPRGGRGGVEARPCHTAHHTLRRDPARARHDRPTRHHDRGPRSVARARVPHPDRTGEEGVMMIGHLFLEFRRTLRSSGTLLFTLVFPAVFYVLETLLFAGSESVVEPRQIMVGMTVWGAMTAGLLVGTRIVDERASGWQRVIRLTPLPARGYLTAKVVVGVFIALPAVVAVPLVSVLVDGVSQTVLGWVLSSLGIWIGSVTFAVLGVAVGLFATKDNVQTIVIVLMLALATLGGLFLPLGALPEWWTSVARTMPSYWLAELGAAGDTPMRALTAGVVLAAWLGALVSLSLWRYDRVTERV
ncbi:ABC transporter ATP-binding protein/permease [Actinomyces polynesiensis]|uniref:ABC transporter ATP-binding protein/permease n=1 Tax=Actinomyces polynesiensis TaxID=1325934 RepID=UPI000A87C3AC|nr:ATP-binding cassette domain-containing protein [Actinomyces polynesiensis]